MDTLDLFRLDGRTAVVTGGGGLGLYMAEALSDAGVNVVLCSRKLEPLVEVKEEIEARGGHALTVACDVTKQEDVEAVASQAEEAFGGPACPPALDRRRSTQGPSGAPNVPRFVA